ncbi:MAG: hypothetical protein ACOYT9_00375 [Patescibacteria group bacterium]
MRVAMKLHSTTFWEKSPLLIRRTSPRLKDFSRDVNEYLYSVFGTPFFHFYVLETLFKACKKKLKASQERVVIVDVCFSENTVNHMMAMFDPKETIDSNVFLIHLSTWLTEQISAYLTQDKLARFPAIYVRCIKIKEVPEEKRSKVLKPAGIGVVARHILLHFGHETKEDVFFILFPSSGISHRVSISIKTPVVPDNEGALEFDTLEASFGKKDIYTSHRREINEIFQLVEDNHVDFALAHSESDDCYYIWIKHLGSHETWLTNEKNGSENWQLVAENSWVLIEPETYIVLGRVAEVDIDGLRRNLILPGSMVLTVEH